MTCRSERLPVRFEDSGAKTDSGALCEREGLWHFPFRQQRWLCGSVAPAWNAELPAGRQRQPACFASRARDHMVDNQIVIGIETKSL